MLGHILILVHFHFFDGVVFCFRNDVGVCLVSCACTVIVRVASSLVFVFLFSSACRSKDSLCDVVCCCVAGVFAQPAAVHLRGPVPHLRGQRVCCVWCLCVVVCVVLPLLYCCVIVLCCGQVLKAQPAVGELITEKGNFNFVLIAFSRVCRVCSFHFQIMLCFFPLRDHGLILLLCLCVLCVLCFCV